MREVRILLKTILVDDEELAISGLEYSLKQYKQIEIIGQFTDIYEALKKVKEEKIDVVFLDIEMPGMNGLEFADHILKYDPNIQIIFVTAYNTYAVEAFATNVQDYILKPVSEKRLAKTIERILKKYEMLMTIYKLDIQSKTDYLTGLYNRRCFTDKIKKIAKSKDEENYALIIADVDYFKMINDTYGHNCGDFVLKVISKLIHEVIRKNDLLVRWGGDEFIIFLSNINLKGVKIISERIRKKIKEKIIKYKNIELSITMTLGVTLYNKDKEIEENIKKADTALYQGKVKGRDCVVISND